MNPLADLTRSLQLRPRPSTLRSLSRRRALPLASALAGLALLAPACGAATASQAAQLRSTDLTSSGPSDPGKFAASLAYSGCMRSHGVPSFPDPKQVAGGGIQISGSRSGMNPDLPLFVSAQESCRHLLPGGGQPTRVGQQQALARILHISQCMRAHGIAGFPDPTLSPPSSRVRYSQISSNGIAWLAIPDSIDVRSPAFGRAAAACNLGLS